MVTRAGHIAVTGAYTAPCKVSALCHNLLPCIHLRMLVDSMTNFLEMLDNIMNEDGGNCRARIGVESAALARH